MKLSMKSLGSAISISASGKLVVRSEKTPRMGSEVKDKEGRKIGKVVQIIGPVKKPFILIKPRGKSPEKHVGKGLFL
jgi:RNA-binding protein